MTTQASAQESATPAFNTPAPNTPEQQILARIHSEVGPERFARFFDRQAQFTLAPGRLDVTVPNGFAAQMLDRRFGDVLRRAAKGQPTGVDRPGQQEPVEVRFRVDGGAFGRGAPSQAAPGPSTAAGREVPARPRIAAPRPAAAPLRRLEDFVVGGSNRLAYSAVEEFCRQAEGKRHPPLFIHGRCGVGKTHLLQGIAARCRERAGATVKYTTAEAFTNEFITAVKANRIDPFRRAMRAVDVLCIDDVHFLSAKHGTQNELLHTFDALDLSGARVVMASDEHPRSIQKLSDSLASRFMAGMVVQLQDPEPELRERIVLAIASQRGLTIDPGAARLIGAWKSAGASGASVRDLEGLVTRVEAIARLLSPAGSSPVIDSTAARRAMGLGAAGDRPSQSRPRRPIRVEVIAAEVCQTLGVEYGEMCGRGRHARVVLARSLTAWLSRKLTTMSFPEIARAMGRPNHSSVITAYQRVEGQMAAGKMSGPECGALSLSDLAQQLEDRLVRGATPA